jgi:hypothetical protein
VKVGPGATLRFSGSESLLVDPAATVSRLGSLSVNRATVRGRHRRLAACCVSGNGGS